MAIITCCWFVVRGVVLSPWFDGGVCLLLVPWDVFWSTYCCNIPLWPSNICKVLDGSPCIVLCNFFRGFPYIFCILLDTRIYIPHLPCRVDKTFLETFQTVLIFLSHFLPCSFWGFSVVAIVVSLLVGLADEFHVHYHYFVIFVLLQVSLAFLRCFQFERKHFLIYLLYTIAYTWDNNNTQPTTFIK